MFTYVQLFFTIVAAVMFAGIIRDTINDVFAWLFRRVTEKAADAERAACLGRIENQLRDIIETFDRPLLRVPSAATIERIRRIHGTEDMTPYLTEEAKEALKQRQKMA